MRVSSPSSFLLPLFAFCGSTTNGPSSLCQTEDFGSESSSSSFKLLGERTWHPMCVLPPRLYQYEECDGGSSISYIFSASSSQSMCKWGLVRVTSTEFIKMEILN